MSDTATLATIELTAPVEARLHLPPRPIRSAGSTALRDACIAAKACDDLRGRETVVLDLRLITPLFDFFVISTGSSPRQVRALADVVEQAVKAAHPAANGQSYGPVVEGYEIGDWVVQDYGDVVTHLFQAEKRALYDLEHLWGDAPQIDWQQQLTASA